MSSRKKYNSESNVGAIIGSVVFWFFIILIIFCAFYFNVKYIETGSMKPTLQIGSIVLVNPHKEAHIGDITMYQKNNYYVIHRLIGENEDGTYVFKGDNVQDPDMDPVSKEQIVGPVSVKINFVAPIVRVICGLTQRQ